MPNQDDLLPSDIFLQFKSIPVRIFSVAVLSSAPAPTASSFSPADPEVALTIPTHLVLRMFGHVHPRVQPRLVEHETHGAISSGAGSDDAHDGTRATGSSVTSERTRR